MRTISRVCYFFVFLSLIVLALGDSAPRPSKKPSNVVNKPKVSKVNRERERYDKSVNEYLTDRTCWWNEMCKEEFSIKFRCRCPLWSFCSSPGRYYNAYCTMSGTGYLWSQPKGSGGGNPYFRRPYTRKRLASFN